VRLGDHDLFLDRRRLDGSACLLRRDRDRLRARTPPQVERDRDEHEPEDERDDIWRRAGRSICESSALKLARDGRGSLGGTETREDASGRLLSLKDR